MKNFTCVQDIGNLKSALDEACLLYTSYMNSYYNSYYSCMYGYGMYNYGNYNNYENYYDPDKSIQMYGCLLYTSRCV